MPLPFVKMNGSGNDFVIFDGRVHPVQLTPEQIRTVSSRQNTATRGCDQVIVLESANDADVFMRIYNADGGEVSACGNATRCVAGILEHELERLPVSIRTRAALLHGVQKAYTEEEHEYVLVDMGEPKFDWTQIPLALPAEEVAQKIEQATGLAGAQFVSMGNPHVVFFLRFSPDSDAQRDDEALFELAFEDIGPSLEQNRDLFPEGVNVSIALLRQASDGRGHIINARVWERGAGLTQACGTAACAMLAAANALDRNIASAHIWFEPFGTAVTTKIDENAHILLGGRIEEEFTGVVDV
jgi:diaminopimelate epimerase